MMNTNEELAWTALRFISGEMNDDEVAAFEARLAEDQQAREAVADAVELTAATCVALAEPTVTRRSISGSDSRLWYGIGVGVAASLLVMLAIYQFGGSQHQVASPAGETVEPSLDSDGALAVRWSEIREQEAAVDAWDELADNEPVEVDADTAASTNAPSWMLAAVEQSRVDDSGMDDGPVEQ